MLLVFFGVFFGTWSTSYCQTQKNTSSSNGGQRNPNWSQFFYFGPPSEQSPPNGFFYQIGNSDLIKRIDNNFNIGPYEDFENSNYFNDFFSTQPSNYHRPTLTPRHRPRPDWRRIFNPAFQEPGPVWSLPHLQPRQFSQGSGFRPSSRPDPNYYHFPSFPRPANTGRPSQRPPAVNPFLYNSRNNDETISNVPQEKEVITVPNEGIPDGLNDQGLYVPFPYLHNRPINDLPKNESLNDSEARQGVYQFNSYDQPSFIQGNTGPQLNYPHNPSTFPPLFTLSNINRTNNNSNLSPGTNYGHNGVRSYFLPPGTSYQFNPRHRNPYNTNSFSNSGLFHPDRFPYSRPSLPRNSYNGVILQNHHPNFSNPPFYPSYENGTRHSTHPSEINRYNPYLPPNAGEFHRPPFNPNFIPNNPYQEDPIYDPYNPYFSRPFDYYPLNEPADPYNFDNNEANKFAQKNETSNSTSDFDHKNITTPSPVRKKEDGRERMEVVSIRPTRGSRRRSTLEILNPTTPVNDFTKRLRRTSHRPTRPSSLITIAPKIVTRRTGTKKIQTATEANFEVKDDNSYSKVTTTTNAPTTKQRNVARRNLRTNPANVNTLFSTKRTTPIKTPISPPTNAEAISPTEPFKI